MSLKDSTGLFNPTSEKNTPEEALFCLQQTQEQVRHFIVDAARSGMSFDEAERNVWEMVKKVGFVAMELLLRLQGNGDLGKQVNAANDKVLERSPAPVVTTVRSIFGHHHFEEFAYSSGNKRKVELYPISARLQLPEHQWSYLLQEFSQLFCVDQAFNQAARNLETIWGSKFSVDTLEQTSQRMGKHADQFLDRLPVPKKEEEAAILVASADCKGVPLVKKDTEKVAAFEKTKKNPGNRRMATVTTVYSVDRFERSPEEIVAALFRDDRDAADNKPKRPKPKFKNTTAHFPTVCLDQDEEIQISGIHEGIAWLTEQVLLRRQTEQPLVLLMDGQESLWDVAAMHLSSEAFVPVLDIIHVSTYVWNASALLYHERNEREEFTRDRLLRILKGDVKAVIRGMRRMGAVHELRGEKLNELEKICNYFENNKSRMEYDQYLKAGYPIASGVIEGACGHLVKDRMERSGMRWKLESARSMLNVRAAYQSDYWALFQQTRIKEQTEIVHPNRTLTEGYAPLTLAC